MISDRFCKVMKDYLSEEIDIADKDADVSTSVEDMIYYNGVSDGLKKALNMIGRFDLIWK